MKRLTTETPKDNLEAALNLFYIKDHETWVRGYGPAPEYADVSLFDLTRDIVKTHIPDAELPADNDDLSNMMPEWLMDGIDSAEGVVALLYTAAWAYAELRHKLMRYEDNGLTPEEIKNALDVNDIIPEINVTVDHLRDLLKAEQEGRLVVLPCKVGAPVYTTHWWKDVKEKCTDSHGKPFYRMMSKKIIKKERFDPFGPHYEWLGKTVFLTREEAEAAMAQEGESDGN